jgi:hypothetical protein
MTGSLKAKMAAAGGGILATLEELEESLFVAY